MQWEESRKSYQGDPQVHWSSAGTDYGVLRSNNGGESYFQALKNRNGWETFDGCECFLTNIAKHATSWSLKLDEELGTDLVHYGPRKFNWVRKRIRNMYDRAHNQDFRSLFLPEEKFVSFQMLITGNIYSLSWYQLYASHV